MPSDDEIPQLIGFESHGVKCDTPGCHYSTSEGLAKPEDYAAYVDKPCPKCGANLLTAEDFRALQVAAPLIELVNAVAAHGMTDDELAAAMAGQKHRIECGSDGKGGIDLGFVRVELKKAE